MTAATNGSDNNMISNLPLLFANGYPTSLEKISETQLQRFIPFMVQCSLGYINVANKRNYSEPEWWPEDVPFVIPLTKPNSFKGNWMEKMKNIILICYQFHKSVFLLRFCSDLASYEQPSLRFINNCNSTTSLYDRLNNKLLVTFRNENMSYDQPQKNRKCLLQRKANAVSSLVGVQQVMVEPAPFDIYLCDNCDAELYSKKAMLEHEKVCSLDVIVCESPDPEIKTNIYNQNGESCRVFLSNFGLQSKDAGEDTLVRDITQNVSLWDNSDGKHRFPRRNRTVHSAARCPSIPLSSPAGQQLLPTTKLNFTREYINERLERMERFCFTPLPLSGNLRVKGFEKKITSNNVQCTYKRLSENQSRMYLFPSRQFASRTRANENFVFLNSNLITQCRPMSVRLKKLHKSSERTVNIVSNQKEPTKAVVATIDLCSSDNDDNDDDRNNILPRRHDNDNSGGLPLQGENYALKSHIFAQQPMQFNNETINRKDLPAVDLTI